MSVGVPAPKVNEMAILKVKRYTSSSSAAWGMAGPATMLARCPVARSAMMTSPLSRIPDELFGVQEKII